MLIAYSVTLKKPGCVLLQIALGADREAAHAFRTETWITGTGMDTLKVYEVTPEQLKRLVKITDEANPPKENQCRPSR